MYRIALVLSALAGCADTPAGSAKFDASGELEAGIALEAGVGLDARIGLDATMDAEAQCVGTWDCATYEIARVICGDRDCRVCVQNMLPDGTAVAWLALEHASVCACPAPSVIPPDAGSQDASILALDAGP